MALAKTTFNKRTGGIPRRRSGLDHVCGLMFYDVAAGKPSEFGSDKYKIIYTLKQAEDIGIDETSYPSVYENLEHYFAIAGNNILVIGVTDAPATNFEEVKEMQQFAELSGTGLRQIGVYTELAFDDTKISVLDAKVKELDTIKKPLSAVIKFDYSVEELSTLPDLRTGSSYNKVSVLLGGSIGLFIGSLAEAKVHESVAAVDKFDVSSVIDEPNIFTGDSYVDSISVLDDLDTKGYIFLVKVPEIVGTFWSSDKTCSDDDYDSIRKNRTIDKSIRLVNREISRKLNTVHHTKPSDGSLALETIETFKSDVENALSTMRSSSEISGFSVEIDPFQDVASTDEIEISYTLISPVLARYITISAGYGLQTS